MKANVSLSTQFVTSQNAHQIRALVSLNGEAPVKRAPINVALVLDRSGSMADAPLAAAREAARRFAQFLGPDDRLTVVTFDDTVHTIFGPAAGGNPLALEAIDRIEAGGSTNLSGGWLEGRRQVAEGLVDGTNRVVLLTDGHANAGLVEPPRLTGLAISAREQRVSTTCIGFGANFNEDLLRAFADAGGGNYWYVEAIDQMGVVFQGEIEGLVALAAQNVTVEVRPLHPGLAGISFLPLLPLTTLDDGWRVALGDLYATSPRSIGIVAHVEEVAELGTVTVAEVKVRADIVTDEGVTHQVITLPVVANLDGTVRMEPVVEQTFLRFELARAREEAVARADRGEFTEAARTLREAAGLCESIIPYDPAVTEIRDDVLAEAARLEERQYDARDRKYHLAQSMAERDLKADYARKIRRKR
jgi:Ca-activated chloride channel family protein